MPSTPLQPLGLSTGAAAKYLGVSAGTIRRWADSGYLEHSRTPGGQRRFSRAALNAAVKLWAPPTPKETGESA